MMVFLTVGTCNNHSIFKKEERRGEGIFNLFWFWVWLGLIHQILFGWHLVILMLGTVYLVTKCFIFVLHQIQMCIKIEVALFLRFGRKYQRIPTLEYCGLGESRIFGGVQKMKTNFFSTYVFLLFLFYCIEKRNKISF